MVYAERLPPAVVHQPYHHQLPGIATTGCTGFQPEYRLAGGELPAGLRLEGDGRLQGEPERVESGTALIRVSTPCSGQVTEWNWTVRGAPMLFVEPAEIILDSAATRATALVSSSWPGLAYTITNASGGPLPPWLTAHPGRGRTPHEGSALTGDRLQLVAAPSQAPPGATAELLIHAWNAREPVVLIVRFGPPPAGPR